MADDSITIDGISFTYNDYNHSWMASIRGRDNAESALEFWKGTVGDSLRSKFIDDVNLSEYQLLGRKSYTSTIRVEANQEEMEKMARSISERSRDVKSRGSFDPEYQGRRILGLNDRIEKQYFEKIIAPSLGGWEQMERDAKATAEEAKKEAILFDQEIFVDVSDWGKGWVAKGKSMRQCRVTLNKNSESLKVNGSDYSIDIPLTRITSIEKDTRKFAKTGDIVIKYGSQGLMVRPGEHLQKFIYAFQEKGQGGKVEESLEHMPASGGGKRRRKTKRRKSMRKKKSTKKRRTKKRKTKKRRSRR